MPNSKNINNGAFGMAMLIIVTIIIIILVVWAVQKKNKAQKDSEHIVWPPDDYMMNIGSKCPDYWVPVSDDGKNVTCQNKFNIPVASKLMGTGECYHEGTGYPNSVTFNKIGKWPAKSADLTKRCDWIKKCGAKRDVFASWSGIDNKC
jgi:hypothetical protein